MEKIDTDWKTTKLKSLAKLFKPFNRDWAPLKIELIEEFSEAKIYKIKPELRNSNVNADHFYSAAEYSNQLPDATTTSIY